MLQRQNNNSQINSQFTPATNLKTGTYVLIPNFTTQKRVSKKLQPLRKGSYQIIDKTTDVTYKLTDVNKKNRSTSKQSLTLLPERVRPSRTYSKYAFTGLKVIQSNSDHKQNQSTDMNPIQKQLDKNEKELPKQTSKNVDNKKIPQTERKNCKIRTKHSTTKSKRKVCT